MPALSERFRGWLHRPGSWFGSRRPSRPQVPVATQPDRELRESRDEFKALFESVETGILMIDQQTHELVDANQVASEMVGLPREKIVGSLCHKFVCPAETGRCPVTDLGQSVDNSERVLLTANGERRAIIKTVRPVTISGRSLLLESFIDITERKHAETALRESEQRYRDLFENAAEIIFTTDLEGRFTTLNLAGQRAFGIAQQAVAAMTIWQLVAPESWPAMQDHRARMMAGETQITSEIGVKAIDGRQLRLEVRPRLIVDGGKPIGIQAIALDITGRDKAEIELRQAQKLESVGRLAAGIAHEINTPIQFVGDNARFLRDCYDSLKALGGKFRELCDAASQGNPRTDLVSEIRLMEEEMDLPCLLDEIPNALDQTLEGVNIVATIVRALKEFAHPEGREMAAADLNQALLSTMTIARNELKYVADVHTEFGDIPLVECNVGDLNQVFLNLLVNAAHAIADAVKEGEKGRIVIRTSAEDEGVRISISDTGTGIPEDIRANIFDPFFTTKEVGRGTGQGLAIARSVVMERHKGTLTFESEVGKGTTFHIVLPVSPMKKSANATEPAAGGVAR
jgi:PAS domain S-box-containing protein